jgi:glycosyltransferase involved in cell wall biosynthesis
MRSYVEAMNDGVDGFVSDDPEEWAKIIWELMQNTDLCEYIGENARQRAETDYDYKQRTKDYIAAFTQREDDDD